MFPGFNSLLGMTDDYTLLTFLVVGLDMSIECSVPFLEVVSSIVNGSQIFFFVIHTVGLWSLVLS